MWYRHLYGVALAVLLAAAVFFAAAWGYVRVANVIGASVAASGAAPPAEGIVLPANGGPLYTDLHLMLGGGTLLAVGLAVGLLMVIPRVSPLAAGLPGLVLVALTVLWVVNVREAVRLIPLKNQDFGSGFELLLFSGLLGAAGMAMIVPLFIPSRWRRQSWATVFVAPIESTPSPFATVAPATGGFEATGASDPDPTPIGFTTPGGDAEPEAPSSPAD